MATMVHPIPQARPERRFTTPSNCRPGQVPQDHCLGKFLRMKPQQIHQVPSASALSKRFKTLGPGYPGITEQRETMSTQKQLRKPLTRSKPIQRLCHVWKSLNSVVLETSHFVDSKPSARHVDWVLLLQSIHTYSKNSKCLQLEIGFAMPTAPQN